MRKEQGMLRKKIFWRIRVFDLIVVLVVLVFIAIIAIPNFMKF